MEDKETLIKKAVKKLKAEYDYNVPEIAKQDRVNSPELEYAVEVANTFGEHVANVFALRLPEIDQSFKQKYLDSVEVQDTLRAFHLDAEKFWYLCLFIKDIVEGYAEGIEAITPREEIIQLSTLLNTVDTDKENSKICNMKSNALLSLKVGKETVKIDNYATLLLIKEALIDLIKSDWELLDDFSHNMTKLHKSVIYKVAWFNRFLSRFLKDKVADKAIYASKGSAISTDKGLLISRMIFVLNISDDENFFDEYHKTEEGEVVKSDQLKGYLKRYKNVKLPAHQTRYFLQGTKNCLFLFPTGSLKIFGGYQNLPYLCTRQTEALTSASH